MKNKKGFTLIELLAVIVILAVIALIATPIILNMIENAKKGAAKDSAYGYIEAIEYNNSMADLGLNNNYTKILDGKDLDVTGLDVKVKGSKPDSGTVTIEKGNVTNAELCINGYNILYDGKEANISDNTKCGSDTEKEPEETKYAIYKTGTKEEVDVIYYNPVEGKKCTKEAAEKNLNENGLPTGIVEGCMKWYVIENSDENKSTVNVMLDHNTTPIIVWNSSLYTIGGMKEVQNELDKLKLEFKWKNDARLITADEIATITGNTTFKGTETTYDKWFHLDSNNQSEAAHGKGASKYAWLYDYIHACDLYGCDLTDEIKYDYGVTGSTSYIFGYWTSTPIANDDMRVWIINSYGRMDDDYADRRDYYGVRPVITVDKSIIQ